MLEAEHSFTTRVLVEIESFGLPERHESNIIARVTREMELQFGGRAHVTQIKEDHPSYIRHREMVEEQVQQLGEISPVPAVRSSETAAGTGLRPLPNNLLAMRLPFPGSSTEEGSS